MSWYIILCYVMTFLCYVMIGYDMIWYVMICYDMLWYVMICHVMICYDMIWYDMIWHVMSQCIIYNTLNTMISDNLYTTNASHKLS